MFELDQAKVDTMSFTEKYFTGTAFLKGIWFFYIASVPFLVSSFYTIIHQPEEAAGYYQLFFTCFMFAGMGIWLIACSKFIPLSLNCWLFTNDCNFLMADIFFFR